MPVLTRVQMKQELSRQIHMRLAELSPPKTLEQLGSEEFTGLIQRAYRDLTIRYHPDRAGDTPDNKANFNLLNEVHEEWSDAARMNKFPALIADLRAPADRVQEAGERRPRGPERPPFLKTVELRIGGIASKLVINISELLMDRSDAEDLRRALYARLHEVAHMTDAQLAHGYSAAERDTPGFYNRYRLALIGYAIVDAYCEYCESQFAKEDLDNIVSAKLEIAGEVYYLKRNHFIGTGILRDRPLVPGDEAIIAAFEGIVRAAARPVDIGFFKREQERDVGPITARWHSQSAKITFIKFDSPDHLTRAAAILYEQRVTQGAKPLIAYYGDVTRTTLTIPNDSFWKAQAVLAEQNISIIGGSQAPLAFRV